MNPTRWFVSSLARVSAVSTVTLSLLAPSGPAFAAQAAKSTAKPAAAPVKAATPVDKVIELTKSGLSEDLVLRSIAKESLTADLSSDDMIKLKKAGVSDRIIAAMEPTPAAVPAAAPPAVAPTPATPAAVAVPVVSVQSMKKRVVISQFDFTAQIAMVADKDKDKGGASGWAGAIREFSNRDAKSQQVAADLENQKRNRQNLGNAIRTQFVSRLAEEGKVVIIERGEVAKEIETEQDRNLSNRVKQGTGGRVGQERGADAILTGDITTYSRDDKTKSSSLNLGIGIGKNKTESKAVVVINYRLIDAETLEILATGEARGESGRTSAGKSVDLGGIGKSSKETSTNFDEVLYAEATQSAIDDLAKAFNTKMDGARRVTWPLETTVAFAEAGRMTISAGEPDGVNVGEVFQIYHVKKVITDPVTKEVIDTDKELLGEMTITTVNPKSSSGTYVGPAAKAGVDTLAIKKVPAAN